MLGLPVSVQCEALLAGLEATDREGIQPMISFQQSGRISNVTFRSDRSWDLYVSTFVLYVQEPLFD